MKTMKQFKNLALTCKSPQEFYNMAKAYDNVPIKVSQHFADKYGHHHDPYKAAEAFYYDCHKAAINKEDVKELLDNGSWMCIAGTIEAEKAEDMLDKQRYSIPYIRKMIDDSVMAAAIELRNNQHIGAPIEDFVVKVLAPKIGKDRIKRMSEKLPKNTYFFISI